MQVIPLIGLLTVDPRDRLKLSDLKNQEWIKEHSKELQHSALLMSPDMLTHSAQTDMRHYAYQGELRVQVSRVFHVACIISICIILCSSICGIHLHFGPFSLKHYKVNSPRCVLYRPGCWKIRKEQLRKTEMIA
jgi:hypothetical protein